MSSQVWGKTSPSMHNPNLAPRHFKDHTGVMLTVKHHNSYKVYHVCLPVWSAPRHDKTNIMSVRPAKTQISLGIRPVWSESSQCAQWVAKDPSFLRAGSEDSDQTGRLPRLIWVFAGCTFILLVLSCRGSFHKLVLVVVAWPFMWLDLSLYHIFVRYRYEKCQRQTGVSGSYRCITSSSGMT